MKITVLEDRPWVMEHNIRMMQEKGAVVDQLVWFREQPESEPDKEKDKVDKLCGELKLKQVLVNNANFNEELDKLYCEKDRIFLFDMDLAGDYSRHFEDRINAIYAKNKKREENSQGRIWFYTSGPASAVEQIKINFPDRNVPVVNFDPVDQQLYFDEKYIEKDILKLDGSKD